MKKRFFRKRCRCLCTAIFFLTVMVPMSAFAFTAPGDGDTGYEIYEFLSTTILDGAIGISIVMGLMGFAGWLIARSQGFAAVGVFVGAIVFFNAENIALAMGVTF